MEGELSYYKGVVSGFKKVYAYIDSSDFVACKGQRNSSDFKELIRIPLELIEGQSLSEVFPVTGKGNT
jgi:hypothetical protein